MLSSKRSRPGSKPTCPRIYTIVAADEYGRPQLPKGARERWTSQPARGDLVAVRVDPRTGEIRQTVYELPQRKPTGDAGGKSGDATLLPKARPDVTQKGDVIIGDLRTEALHQALRENAIGDDLLIGMLVLALGSNNVEIKSGVAGSCGGGAIRAVAERLIEGDALTSDSALLRQAARDALVQVLSCRVNHSSSGMKARLAGAAIGADAYLANMATEEFLSCLSKPAISREAEAAAVPVGARAKDTRAALVAEFGGSTWVYSGARFAPSDAELARKRALTAARLDDEPHGEELDDDGGADTDESFDPLDLEQDGSGSVPDNLERGFATEDEARAAA